MNEFSNLPKRPSIEDRRRFYGFLGFLVFLTVALVGISLLMGQAKHSDLGQEKLLHASCVVKDKEVSASRYGRDYSTYTIKTSCGDFVTDANLYGTIMQDETYDLTTTAGNWANKSTITLAEPSTQ